MNHWTFVSDQLKRLNNEHEGMTNLVASEVFHIEGVFEEVKRINAAEMMDPRTPSPLWQQYKTTIISIMSRYAQQLIDATVQAARALDSERKMDGQILGQQSRERIPPPPGNGRG